LSIKGHAVHTTPMPKRKRSYAIKRRPKKRRVTKKLRRRAVRPMRPRTYNFTRKEVQTIELVAPGSGTDPATNWYLVDNGMCTNRTFSLNQVPNSSEFTNLFTQYRINAVKQTFFFSNTNSDASSNIANRQIIMYAVPNRSGTSSDEAALTEQFFMENSATKQKLCLNTNGRPISIYTKLDQLNKVYGGPGVTNYVRSRPKFINTNENALPHVGVQLRFQRVDNKPFSDLGTLFPQMKVVTKYYFQTRQVS